MKSIISLFVRMSTRACLGMLACLVVACGGGGGGGNAEAGATLAPSTLAPLYENGTVRPSTMVITVEKISTPDGEVPVKFTCTCDGENGRWGKVKECMLGSEMFSASDSDLNRWKHDGSSVGNLLADLSFYCDVKPDAHVEMLIEQLDVRDRQLDANTGRITRLSGEANGLQLIKVVGGQIVFRTQILANLRFVIEYTY